MWVDERECFSMEHEACIRPAVQAVADDRHADPDGGVDAQLMSPARLGAERDTGATALPGEHLPFGDRREAVLVKIGRASCRERV